MENNTIQPSISRLSSGYFNLFVPPQKDEAPDTRHLRGQFESRIEAEKYAFEHFGIKNI